MYAASAAEQTERERARAHQSRETSIDSQPEAVPIWTPQPGPQTAAYESEADVLGYGGEAGGGKTDLLIGLPGTRHWRSIIFRREFPRVRAIIERSREIFNAEGNTAGKDSYNEQTHLWRLDRGRQLEFAAMQREDAKLNYQGRPHDFYGFDEAPEFSESQVRFVIGWCRSTHIDSATGKPQRCRVVLTFNPPMNEAGEWIIKFFLPWLAHLHPETYSHPNPAAPGELRWYAQAEDEDEEHEVSPADLAWYVEFNGRYWQVDTNDLVQEGKHQLVPQRGYVNNGKLVTAKSRTFIPASLKDNPELESRGYAATINAMPEPYRSLLRGRWGSGHVADPWQVIPREWVKAAQARWKPERPVFADGSLVPLSAIGQDVARGGADDNVLSKRYGAWFAPLEVYPGALTPDGPSAAALTLNLLSDHATVNVDVIGVGGSAYDSLIANGVSAVAINFGAGSKAHDISGKIGFLNVRAEAYWKFREALDPSSGQDIALPPDPQLLSDLCAPKWTLTARGVQIEPKEQIKKRLGRSPDRGDAVVLAHFVDSASGQQILNYYLNKGKSNAS